MDKVRENSLIIWNSLCDDNTEDTLTIGKERREIIEKYMENELEVLGDEKKYNFINNFNMCLK